MNIRIPYITETEQLIIELIADGQSYFSISQKISCLSPLQIEHIRGSLCRKVGLPNTKDPRFAQRYLGEVAQALRGPGPNAYQSRVIEEISQSGFFRFTDEIESALRSAGIFTRNPTEARIQCRAHLCASRDLPMIDTTTKQALQLYAEGCPIPEISEIIGDNFPKHTQKRIREGCKALGLSCRGRNAQRRLVTMVLERLNTVSDCDKAEEKDPLDGF